MKPRQIVDEMDSYVPGRSQDEIAERKQRTSLSIRAQLGTLNPEEQQASFENKLCTMNLTNPSAPLLGGFVVDVKPLGQKR